jgi:hypothetical protein
MPPPQEERPPGGWHGTGWTPPTLSPPGVVPLRPLRVTEIIDGAFTTIRRYPALMLGGSAIVVGLSQLLTFVLALAMLPDLARFAELSRRPDADPDEVLDAMGPMMANVAAETAIAVLAQVSLTGFLTVVVGQAVLGRKLSPGQAWDHLRPRLVPLFGLTIAYGVIVLAGIILLVIPGIWLFVLFGLATPALVLESVSINAALRRSRELVRDAWWRTFGILLLAGLLTGIIAGLAETPFALFGAYSPFSLDLPVPTTASLALSAIGATIAGTITYPLVAAVYVLTYLDQRMRREGLHVELARAAV